MELPLRIRSDSYLVALSVLQDALLLPDVTNSRIVHYDDVLFAHNGIFFQTAFQELGQLLKAPGQWMWDYYNQYPALAIRRHPPVFSLVESIVFSIF